MSKTGRRDGEAGFTLLELIVVLCVAGLLLSLTPSLFASISPRYRAREAASSFADYLLRARNEAILGSRIVRVQITSAGYKKVNDGHLHEWPSQVEPSRVDLPGGGQAGAARQLIFFADGSSSGGLVRLVAGHQSYVIRINWLTGRVTRDE